MIRIEPRPEDLKYACPRCQHPTVPFKNRRKCLNCGSETPKDNSVRENSRPCT